MDQLGNTERTTEEQGSEDQQPTGSAGDTEATRTPCTLAVYRAVPDVSGDAADADDNGIQTDSTESNSGTGSTDTGSTPSATLFDVPIPSPESPQVPTEAPAAGSAPNSTGGLDAGSASAAADTTPAATEPGFVPEDTTGSAGSKPTDPAEPSSVPTDTAGRDGFPDGFTGVLAMANLESFDEQATGEVLARLSHLVRWTQAQEARALNHMEELFRKDVCKHFGSEGPGLAFSLAAAECAAILNVPQTTAQGMMVEAGRLCSTHTATLTGLEEGRFSYAHAQVVLDQCENIPSAELPEFEAELLAKAEGITRPQFCAKARRLREKTYPETIPERHQTAFEKRKVVLERDEDGMSWLSAHLRAEHAQQIYTALCTSARGEQADGDLRTADQLRADILTQLLMGGLGSPRGGGARGSDGCVSRTDGTGRGAGKAGKASRPDDASGTESDEPSEPRGVLPRAEIMVLINAETLFGADEQPAELHGYGPISADAARRLARNAVHWTGLAQDPATGEILGVGRRRKVPAGLARWLRARDGTCRFPGCRVSTAVTEIDHTTDWAKGGNTEHGNLEHLCRRHHRFKTLGFWKATQPTPGIMEWTSPTGRVYRTEPFLDLNPASSSSMSGRKPTDQHDSVPPF
ncbi:HNH endonuclease signature motif containing protein [Arthrobacter yangruifuii]|uniref:HNH endonuclease signature motif containing protein n=1 Tax=Arthrobacter yangruifuii TaxID=2606616 RepID=UPI0011B7FC07|nr:HNH endonuclease signature motif containing protein [Arthrobacter yangruifuii]